MASGGADMLPMIDTMKYGRQLSVHRMFAPAFTMVGCLLFLVPTFILLNIVHNPVLKYFSPWWPYILLVNPFIIAFAHIHHVNKGAPSKRAIIGALCIPSTLLLIVGEAMYTLAEERSADLVSEECSAFHKKANLQRSWESAYYAFESCVNQTASRPGSEVPLDKIYAYFRFPDCEEHAQAAASSGHATSWAYLEYLEENEGCHGWCYPGQQIWANTPSKDSCSNVVATAFKYLMKPQAREIAVVQVFVLFFTALAMIVMGPFLRERRYEW